MFWLVSLRRDFDHTTRFCEPAAAAVKRVFDGALHGGLLEWGDFVEAALTLPRNAVVCWLVHGYRSPLPDALDSYGEIKRGLLAAHAECGTRAPDLFAGLLWPGSWEAVVGYVLAARRADEAGRRFGSLLAALHEARPDVEHWIVAHSLGCRVSLEASLYLDGMALRNIAARVHLAAPAVACDCLVRRYAHLSDWPASITVHFSAGDPVLSKVRRLLPWNWFRPALGSVGARPQPIGEELAYEQFDYSASVHSHGGYRHQDSYFRRICREE